MRPLLLAIGVVLCAGSGSWSNQLQEPAEFGAIEGHVVDPDGKPVAGATIWARHEVLMRHHLRQPQTADDGSFRVESVPQGWVQISASKPEDGYFDRAWGEIVGYPEKSWERVFVRSGEPTRNMILHLGPRGGKLVGTIIDASTGEPLPTSDMWLYRDDMPDNRFFTSADRTARFLLALPDLSYSLEVTHDGYKPWRSDEDGEQIPSQHLRIKSGEELRLTIRLQPVERTRR